MMNIGNGVSQNVTLNHVEMLFLLCFALSPLTSTAKDGGVTQKQQKTPKNSKKAQN